MLTITSKLREYITVPYKEHIQGFPDGAALDVLRGFYRRLGADHRNYSMDPAYKAAAILNIISVAGGLITVTESGYRCNNGFIDSSGTLYGSENPVLQNLRLMAEWYIRNGDFTDTACDYLYNCDDTSAETNLRQFIALLPQALMKAASDDEKMQLNELTRLLQTLNGEQCTGEPEMTVPEIWDAQGWLNEFLPIWNSRDRRRTHGFRAEYYKKHIALIRKGVYISQSGKVVGIPWDAHTLLKQSKMYSQEMTTELPGIIYDTVMEVLQMDCLDAAEMLQKETSGKTAVLNLANRQNPGGGVYTGSGAQEESCFLRSNYYVSLYPYAAYAYYYDLPKAEQHYPLDRNFGGVWSGGVTVFRGREQNGYPLLDEPWMTNFIAVAGLNRPPVEEDENGELRLREDMIQPTLNKIRTIMNIAADNQVDNLVLGALGCGAFRNPPKHIAELFRQVLNEPPYKGRFRRIVFAILGQELCETFRKGLL